MPRNTTALARIHALYRSLPALDCKGLCDHSCVPVTMSRVEAAHMGLPDDPNPSTAAIGPLGIPRCSKLTAQQSCSVYAQRPMICRLWGVSESMRCPHGCTPRGTALSDSETIEMMLHSLIIGGHRLVEDERTVAAMWTITQVPGAAGLLLRLVRGDAAAAVELSTALRRASQGGAQ